MTSSGKPGLPRGWTSRGRNWLLAALAIVAIAAAYWPVRDAGFNWDDPEHITANPTIVGPLGLKEIWTSGKANYFPLTMTSFWLQHRLWGLSPGPYHIVTVLFHVGAALMLWRVLARLGVPGAWLGAMLWALHPVQVESVAWICELKNTQSAFFYLVAIWFFVRWAQRENAPRVDRDYVSAVVAAALAILSKSSTVMLPIVLGLLGWWLGHRRWRDAVWLVPFLAISLLASGWTIWEQKVNSMASGVDWDHGWASRLMIAGKVPWFYLGKLLWPEPLIFIYPRWNVNALGAWHWVPLLGTIGLGVLLWIKRHVWPALFVALTVFFVSLFPVLGIFDVFFFKYSFVADHFQYLASMGPLVLIGSAIVAVLGKMDTQGQRVPLFAGGALLLVLGLMSRSQAKLYLNAETLWRETVRLNPDAWIARMNLGSELLSTGRPQLALPHFEAALRLRSHDGLAQANVGAALVQMGRVAEAIPYLLQAREKLPNAASVHNALGVARMRAGDMKAAIEHLETALRLGPEMHYARGNLAECLLAEGRAAEALEQFQAALAQAPNVAPYHRGAGNALVALGRLPAAAEALAMAVRLDPQDVAARSALADVLNRLNQPAAALEIAAEALRLRPDSIDARYAVGCALVLVGRQADAVPHLQHVLGADPRHHRAADVLAAALFGSGRVTEALPLYEAAVERQPTPEAHNNLASALLMAGRVDAAIDHYEKALAAAPEYHEARLNLSRALMRAERREEALQQIDEVLRRQPDHAGARVLRAEIHAAGRR